MNFKFFALIFYVFSAWILDKISFISNLCVKFYELKYMFM